MRALLFGLVAMLTVPAHADLGGKKGPEVFKTPTVKAFTLAGVPHTVTLPAGWVMYSGSGDGALLEKPGKRYKVWIHAFKVGPAQSQPAERLESWLKDQGNMRQKNGVKERESKDATFVGAPGRIGMISWTEGEDFERRAQLKLVISLSRDIEYRFKVETELGAMTDDQFQSEAFMREINAIYGSVARAQ